MVTMRDKGRMQDFWRSGGGVQRIRSPRKRGVQGGLALGPMLKSLDLLLEMSLSTMVAAIGGGGGWLWLGIPPPEAAASGGPLVVSSEVPPWCVLGCHTIGESIRIYHKAGERSPWNTPGMTLDRII